MKIGKGLGLQLDLEVISVCGIGFRLVSLQSFGGIVDGGEIDLVFVVFSLVYGYFYKKLFLGVLYKFQWLVGRKE